MSASVGPQANRLQAEPKGAAVNRSNLCHPLSRKRRKPVLGAVIASSLLASSPGDIHAAEGDDERAAPASRPYAQFDRYDLKGTTTRLPPASETIIRDYGGFRSALARNGFGLHLMSLNSAFYDVHSRQRTPEQRYQGQQFTGTSNNQFYLTYDLGGSGNDQRQFVLGAANNSVNWKGVGPARKITMTRFSYYQSFLDRRIEMALGYLPNSLEFVGTFVGGSVTGGSLGVNSVIPYAIGMSRAPMGTPALNLTFNFKDSWYNKLGLQRSISPYGVDGEDKENHYGVKWSVPDAKLLLIEEFGLRRAASTSHPYVWVRGGIMYNWSRFARFDEPGRRSENHLFYLLGDWQVTQSGPRPNNGWHVGGTINLAPEDRNPYARYYELRLYKIGPFQSRPMDTFTLSIGHNQFSRDLHRLRGGATETYSTSASVTYMWRVSPGAYVNAGLTYTDHPALAQRLDSALNATVGLNLFF